MWLLFVLSIASAQETLTVPKTLDKRCHSSNEPGACYELASQYMQSSAKADKVFAAKQVMHGCKLELKKDCTPLEAGQRADAYNKAHRETEKVLNGAVEAAPEDPKNPDVIKRKKDEAACLSGNGKACSDVSLYLKFFAPVTNLKKANEWDEKGCALHDESSCDGVKLYKSGILKVFKVEM